MTRVVALGAKVRLVASESASVVVNATSRALVALTAALQARFDEREFSRRSC